MIEPIRTPANNQNTPVTINRSTSIEWNNQRNNQQYPLEACGPTSMSMALLQAGHVDWVKAGEDPADTITKHLLQSKYWEELYKMLNTRNTPWKPFNIHKILCAGTNDLVGEQVVEFKTAWDLREILLNIIIGGGAALAGDFTLSSGRELGHIVSLAGFVSRDRNVSSIRDKADIDLDRIVEFIIDDPYGDYTTGYSFHQGNDVRFSPELFNKTFRQTNNYYNKWAHIVRPKN